MDGIEHLDRAIEHFGSQSALAGRLNVGQSVISMWKTRGRVPAEYCPLIERETHGAVTCEQLRSDVAWDVLRCPGRLVAKAA